MNIVAISRIAFLTLIASVSSLAIAPSASAVLWNIDGTFEDGGKITGTFDFDESVSLDGEYSNINLTTSAGTSILPDNTTEIPGNIYDSENGNLDFFGSFDSLNITDENNDFFLSLEFDDSLSLASSPIALVTTSTSEFDPDRTTERFVTSGTVFVTVPLEFSPTLGIILLGSVWGISHLKNLLK